MKLRPPEGCVSFSYQGRTLAVSHDGPVEVEDEACTVLAAHGFAPWLDRDDTEPPAPAGSQRDEPLAAAPFEPDEIEQLNRPALFAFLKTKGMSVSLPITNQELRRLARSALDAKDTYR